jgi:hypothetical protein
MFCIPGTKEDDHFGKILFCMQSTTEKGHTENILYPGHNIRFSRI